MALAKSRQCSESCIELLAIELVHQYAQQNRVPAAAAIDAIGMLFAFTELLSIWRCLKRWGKRLFKHLKAAQAQTGLSSRTAAWHCWLMQRNSLQALTGWCTSDPGTSPSC